MADHAEIVRRGFDHLNANDLEGFLELVHPQIELHDVPEIPGSTIYRGHEGIRRWWATVTDSMDQTATAITASPESDRRELMTH